MRKTCVQVDNASSLMIASKNLMTAVVDTVKASYVASTAVSGIISLLLLLISMHNYCLNADC